MELELKKQSFDTYEAGTETTLTAEETAETIVPDYCPDMARIIDTEGMVFLHGRDFRDGKATLSGTVRVTVLYTPEGEGGIRALEFAIPFTAESEALRSALTLQRKWSRRCWRAGCSIRGKSSPTASWWRG